MPELKNRRSAYKGQLTSVKKDLDAISRDPDKLNYTDTAELLFASRYTLNEIEKNYSEVQHQILELTTDESKKKQEEQDMSFFLGEIQAARAKISTFLGKIEAKRLSTPSTSGGGSNELAEILKMMAGQMEEQKKQREQEQANFMAVIENQRKEFKELLKSAGATKVVIEKQEGSSILDTTVGGSTNHKKLESITIRPFTGNFSEWPTFKDLFLSLVDGDDSLRPAEKMQYLKTYITGDAQPIIDTLKVCDENYKVAWDLLVKEFDIKPLIVASYVKNFYALSGSSTATVQSIQSIQRKANAIVQALDALDVKTRDPFLIYSVLHKLDDETQAEWAKVVGMSQPTWEKFNDFLANRSRQLRMCQSEPPKNTKAAPPQKTQPGKKSKTKATSLNITEAQKCVFCEQSPHKLFRCKKFLGLDGASRLAAVKQLKICENCLSDSHKVEHCTYSLCKFCNSKHNRLLHDVMINSSPLNLQTIPSTSGNRSFGGFGSASGLGAANSAALVCKDNTVKSSKVLLATVIVKILDAGGEEHFCKAMLDSGSQVNLISTRLCQLLKLKMKSANFLVETVGSSVHSSQYQTDVTIRPWMNTSNHAIPINCLVMKNITGDQPNWDVKSLKITIPNTFTLADPNWSVSQPVDLLIGGQHYWSIVRDETHFLGLGLPLMKNTLFGWVIVGPCDRNEESSNVVSCNLATLETCEQALKRFFAIEDVPSHASTIEEHKRVEEIYCATTTRDAEGRFEVDLPLKPNVENLESNRSNALRQLHFLMTRLRKNPNLWEQYAQIFEEYLDKEYIEVIPYNELERKSYYMPHHCVVKEEAVSTKVRIVFNASSPSSSGLSLNDVLMTGPVVQPSLMAVLLNFRLQPVTFTCDIVKMYLQTTVHEQHRDFLRFLWTTSSDNRVKDFRFKRVCFGVSSSPFLATRSLNQLAKEEGQKYPLAAQIVLKHFYVDDCLYSASTVEQAKEVRDQLINLLKLAGLELSKFRSNHPDLQSDIADEQHDFQDFDEQVVKTLGMTLSVAEDTFQYKVAEIPDGPGTLRILMSTIARIFDPLGLVAPVTIVAKMLLQDVWKSWKETESAIDFDQPVESEIEEKWFAFKTNLPHIEQLRIPRWASTLVNVIRRELHCFCDASKLAHGACVYLVTENTTGARSSRLLIAKTKVNPMKFRDQAELTMPKAELCAAELAANLLKGVVSSMEVTQSYLWTDATVVLYQIHNSSRKREAFVKRRIESILKLTKDHQWRHVGTKENPADLASRGATPQALEDSDLWWNGPNWLVMSQDTWPTAFRNFEEPPRTSLIVVQEEVEDVVNPVYQSLLSKFSTYERLRRVTATLLEAIDVWRMAMKRSTRSNPKLTLTESVRVQYLRKAETFLIKSEQEQHLSQVMKALKMNPPNAEKIHGRFRKLRPFLDDESVARVGGRLVNSVEPFDARHPRILPKGPLAKLLAEREHKLMMHSGPQLTLFSLRQKYWLIDGRNITRKVSRNCLPCIKARPPTLEQLMGNLPRDRVVNFRPFAALGVDFAGPIWTRQGNRKSVAVKAYVAVFVCLSTKAVHLELVSSLHTDSFIAAFRRMVARRGLPARIFSDNGTTFIGADREIRRLWQMETHKSAIYRLTSELGIEWTFITPRAPHQGGIYEAAVKAFKHHFVRVIGDQVLTFEALTTILCQIEAILNSRPLIALSDNAEDPITISPSSFLIRSSLTQLPDPDLSHLKMSNLDKWQLIQRVSQEFTKRWKKEYLNTLQVRQKWNKSYGNLKEGDLVLIVDDLLPSTKWPTGVVVATYPGQDQRVRVVDVRTPRGIYKRAIQKLIKFPNEN